MEFRKALQIVMSQWGLSQNALAKLAGLHQSAISAILSGRSKTSEINSLAKGAFWYALQLPDEEFERIPMAAPDGKSLMLESQIDRACNDPVVLARIINLLDEFDLINRENLLKFDENFSRFKPFPKMTREEYLIMLSVAKKQQSLKDDDQDGNQE
jgi:transcriptional regulator with XRE-family HTH domain